MSIKAQLGLKKWDPAFGYIKFALQYQNQAREKGDKNT
jgi:hypothetical protein